jgi:hypothetical protein
VPNLVPRRYRGVSVTSVEVELSQEALSARFIGREAYRHTEFIVARRAGDVAVMRVTKADDGNLFTPIADVELLAPRAETAYVRAPEIDTAVPTQLARAAARSADGARCVVVEGLYRHVSFICDPRPLTVRVVEVAPPTPPKLVDQARRVLESAEDLPPIELRPEVHDLLTLAAEAPAARYLLPCRGSGAAPRGAAVDYLDERPERAEWVLVGCARSREIHNWFYGDDAPGVDMCPERLAREERGLTLTKCCLLESGIRRAGGRVTVPWGASLAEVRAGLEALVEAAEPAWAPA